jgi:phage FluMu protein Com
VTVGAVAQTQVRCRECNRRLGDFVNELEAGQVILELKCPKCGRPHLEIIRPPDEAAPRSSSTEITRPSPAGSALPSAKSATDRRPGLSSAVP